VRVIAPGELEVKAEVKNPLLFTTFGDTYFSDMSQTGQFNGRALIDCLLPAGWETVKNVRVKEVSAGGSPLHYRLVGFAVEMDKGNNRLWIQVELRVIR